MSWATRAAANILPRSVQKKILTIALREWAYTGVCEEARGDDRPSCELCGHPRLRYQFEIRNRLNKNALLIGSECITKFEIPVLDQQGTQLSQSEGKKKVGADRRQLIVAAEDRSVISSLLLLKQRDETLDVDDFINYYRDRGGFTPKQLALLIWKLGENRVPYTKPHFKMKLKRGREQEQLIGLPDWQIRRLWPVMTKSQRELYERPKAAASSMSDDS